MNVISLLAVVMVVITVIKVIELLSKKGSNFKLLDLILMSGALALAMGLLSQIVGITQALAAIRDAADVSPQIVMGGALISFYAPIYGMIVFIFSLFFWFVIKEIIRQTKK